MAGPKEAWSEPLQPDEPRKKAGYKFSCCVMEKGFPGGAAGAPSAASQGPRASQIVKAADMLMSGRVTKIGGVPVTVPNGFYDAHAHLYDFTQNSEGISELLAEMDKNGVSHASIMGCPLKKNWSEFEDRMAPDAFNDTDVLYYFSLSDIYLLDQLRMLPPPSAARFAPMLSGFKPTDKDAVSHITTLIESHPEIEWRGLGEIWCRGSEVTNLTSGPVPHPGTQAWDLIMGEAYQRNLPVIVHQKACSESTKPYKYGFDFVPELDATLHKFSGVNFLWVGAGIFVRGQWGGYKKELDALLSNHPNLYVSVTPEILHVAKLPHGDLTELAEKYPDSFMVGSSTMGMFSKAKAYTKEWDTIKTWLGTLSKSAYQKVRFENANKLFSWKPPRVEKFCMQASRFLNLLDPKHGPSLKNESLHNTVEAKKKDMMPPPEKNRSLKGAEIEHLCIDTHLHMLDFLQKSAGTAKILEAMDGCGVDKAVMIGMPCTKKWSKDEPEKPLYYQDDNGQCYFYSYADQMVADAWLALPDDKRKRFAPVMGSFNPTDISAVDHVQRMWDKYPGLWRGLGEVMCRHDDLTMLLQDDETPVINHMAMKPLYEFCIEHNINCMVHHNADRTAEVEGDDHYEYLWEVEQVLETFPDLKMIWCHAGVSRRTFEESHVDMIRSLVSKYPELIIDISWVVWEEVICEPNSASKIKASWIKLFEDHPTRFTMGSDQVGQFITPAGGNLLKPEIVKYWSLATYCSEATAKAILWGNAQRVWFDGWDMPTSDREGFNKIRPSMRSEILYHNQGYFEWDGEMF